jgi:DnaK suppressor protein
MNAKDLAKFQNLLQSLRQEATGHGPLSIKADKSSDDHEVIDEDVQALSEMNQIIASNRNRKRAGDLGRIDAALNRIKFKPDEYGLCGECEEPIPAKRLELMPFVELCARCQQDKDDAKKPGRRRHLLDYQ